MSKWLVAFITASLGFAVGVAVSSDVRGIGRTVRGRVSVSCVDHRACVGDAIEDFLLRYNRDRGGLTAAYCERDTPRSFEYMFLPDIVRGRTCQSNSFSLEFRNPSTRTLVAVEDGVVIKIEHGPLHVIDF